MSPASDQIADGLRRFGARPGGIVLATAAVLFLRLKQAGSHRLSYGVEFREGLLEVIGPKSTLA